MRPAARPTASGRAPRAHGREGTGKSPAAGAVRSPGPAGPRVPACGTVGCRRLSGAQWFRLHGRRERQSSLSELCGVDARRRAPRRRRPQNWPPLLAPRGEPAPGPEGASGQADTRDMQEAQASARSRGGRTARGRPPHSELRESAETRSPGLVTGLVWVTPSYPRRQGTKFSHGEVPLRHNPTAEIPRSLTGVRGMGGRERSLCTNSRRRDSLNNAVVKSKVPREAAGLPSPHLSETSPCRIQQCHPRA